MNLIEQTLDQLLELRQLVEDEIVTRLAAEGLAVTVRTKASKKYTRKKPAPKYRNPETGQTWSGRGMIPRWLRDVDPTPFMIKQPEKEN